MTPDELQAMLLAAGHECQVKGDEVLVRVCPYCGNEKNNLEINVVNGRASCWACKQPQPGLARVAIQDLTGERLQIPVSTQERRRTLSAPPQDFLSQPIHEVLSAQRYLDRRGVTIDMINSYKIVVCTERDHLLNCRLCIPMHAYWSRELVGWIGRTYINQHPKYLSAIDNKCVTGWHSWESKQMPCVLVEGPFDGMAVHQAGYHAAVLGGTSSPDLDEWFGRLLVPLVVMLDADVLSVAQRLVARAQMTGVRAVSAQLPPGIDPDELQPAEVRRVVTEALR